MRDKEKLNIIMFNMSKYAHWEEGIANRNSHVLRTLAKSDKVRKIIAVDFLPYNFKTAAKTYIKDQIIGDMKGSIVFGNLTSRCWHVTPKIFVFSTVDSVLNKRNIIKELKIIIKRETLQKNLVIWNYNPFYTKYFNQFDQSLNVFDAVDDWTHHSSYKYHKRKLKRNYNTIKEKSDLIFTVSENLKDELFNNQKNINWIPNGVDLDYFKTQMHISDKLYNIPKPIIGFLGILQDRIDVEILLTLAKSNPDKSLVLAGPSWKKFPKNKFEQFKNVHFLGQIHYQEIPNLYNGFDVGIIPYRVNPFIKSTDPMKFYEYLAAGLPIVSTKVKGLERFKKYVQFTNEPSKFSKLVNQALEQDKEKIKQQSEAFLQKNTWEKRINKMLHLIDKKL